MDPIDDCSETVQKLITPSKTTLYDFSVFKVDDSGKTVFFPGYCFNCKSENVQLNNPLITDKVLVCCPNSILYVDTECKNVLKSNPCGDNPTVYDLHSLRECQPYKVNANPERKMKLPLMCTNHISLTNQYTSQRKAACIGLPTTHEIFNWINKWKILIESDGYKNKNRDVMNVAHKLDYNIITTLDEIYRNKSRKDKEERAAKNNRNRWSNYQESSKVLALNSINAVLMVCGCTASTTTASSWITHRLYVKCTIDGCSKMLTLDGVSSQNKLWHYCALHVGMEKDLNPYKKAKIEIEKTEYQRENCLPLRYITLKKIEAKVMSAEYDLAVEIANCTGEDVISSIQTHQDNRKMVDRINMSEIDEMIAKAASNSTEGTSDII
jgi:hypothetical protein